jgi:hypothetical protein
MQFVGRATAVIANGGTASTPIQIQQEYLLIGCVDLPTLTSCDLEIEGSMDGGANYKNIESSTAQILKKTATTGGVIWGLADEAAKVLGLTHIRFVSSGAQGAERTLLVSFLR